MCLCGMLAAEYQTLPQPMQDAVIGFFDQNESWLDTSWSRAGPTAACTSPAPPGTPPA